MNASKEAALRLLKFEKENLETQLQSNLERTQLIDSLELWGLYRLTQFNIPWNSPKTKINEATVLIRKIEPHRIFCEIVSADKLIKSTWTYIHGRFALGPLKTKSDRREIEIPIYSLNKLGHSKLEKIEPKDLPLYIHHEYKGARFKELMGKL